MCRAIDCDPVLRRIKTVSTLVSRTSARHVEYSSRIQPARVACEPSCEFRYLFGRSQSFHRAIGDHFFDNVRPEAANHVGVDWPRGDAIDEDILADDLAAQRLSERDYAPARRGVDRQTRHTLLTRE